jgi:hypothetical protein
VLADGGPFSHIVLGHSVLHGLGAITAILGLCLARREETDDHVNWRGGALLALPALAIAVNSVAALYCLGVALILLFWGRLWAARSWVPIVLMFGLFLGAWKIMGYSHSQDSALTTINKNPAEQWWMLTVWFMVGLGFRILGFRWLSRPFKDPLFAMALASVLGLLSFSLLLKLPDGNERYGIYFLQSVFSIFAFSRLAPECWRGVERSRWVVEWLGLAKKGMIILVACGILLRLGVYALHSSTWIASFGRQILPCCLLILLLACTSALIKRGKQFSTAGSAIVMGVLMIGFLAWITPWLNFGMGRMKMDIILTPGEVQGLHRLGDLAAPYDRFATNKHNVDSLATKGGRSAGYAALSERPVLLEGYSFHGEPALPWFDAMLHDNDLAFTTTDPETIRAFANTWHVRWLVARPGTDISLPRPLPPWLVEQQNSGDLKIYRID